MTLDLLPEVVRLGRSRRVGRACGRILDSLTRAVVEQGLATAGVEGSGLHTRIVDRVERELITQVMSSCNNVQTKAAVRLGINRNTLHKKAQGIRLRAVNGCTGW